MISMNSGSKPYCRKVLIQVPLHTRFLNDEDCMRDEKEIVSPRMSIL